MYYVYTIHIKNHYGSKNQPNKIVIKKHCDNNYYVSDTVHTFGSYLVGVY